MLQPAHVPADFIDHAGDAAHHRAGSVSLQLQRPLAQPGKAARVVALRPGIVLQIRDGGLGERVQSDVHVIRRVLRHGPAHAELVGQVFPVARVTLGLHDGAFPALGGARRHVARIHMQAHQQFLAGLCQLLHGVHDAQLIANPEMADQGQIGVLVDARLIAAQVNRHAVWNLMVQGSADPLARRQGFSRVHGSWWFRACARCVHDVGWAVGCKGEIGLWSL